MSEIKQTNFRISKEAADAFRSFCEEQGVNQAQGFDYLLEVLALDKARSTVKSRETEIADFEHHAKALISAYLYSLELNENAEARIKDQFSTQIESQIQMIAEYQTRISETEQQLQDAMSLAQSIQADYNNLLTDVADIKEKRTQAEENLRAAKADKEKQLADKDSIITMLSAKLAEAERKAENYDAMSVQAETLQRDLATAQQTIKDNAKDAEIAQERAVRAAEKALEAEHRKELERLRSQNTELLQTMAATEKSAAEEIRTIEKENASLREQLALQRKNLEDK